MKATFRAPPNPWFYAHTTAASRVIGILPNSKVAVRQSRRGGWRVVTSNKHMVISDEKVADYLDTGASPQLTDQEKAEAHFQKLLAMNAGVE